MSTSICKNIDEVIQMKFNKFIKDIFFDIKQNEKQLKQSTTKFDKEFNSWKKKQHQKWKPSKKYR